MTTAKKILIVEDDPEVSAMCSMAVESWGYRAVQSNDGEEGWQTLEKDKGIALIILDIGLPHLDGRDFIRRLRNNTELKNKPVIVISGIVTLNEIREYLEMGASRFLPKPFSISDLKEYTEKLLRNGAE